MEIVYSFSGEHAPDFGDRCKAVLGSAPSDPRAAITQAIGNNGGRPQKRRRAAAPSSHEELLHKAFDLIQRAWASSTDGKARTALRRLEDYLQQYNMFAPRLNLAAKIKDSIGYSIKQKMADKMAAKIGGKDAINVPAPGLIADECEVSIFELNIYMYVVFFFPRQKL